ncbi:MAG: hypothetical protein HY748_11775 [Elusimicrobia bacterium]|nr:hypothetical protein [Elusimicrobiota bacterium]
MEQERLLNLGEERFTEFTDKVQGMTARAEDLLFRAQRWANAVKNKTAYKDNLFADDLQILRRHVRSFIQDSTSLAGLMEWIDRECHFDPDTRALDKARSLLKMVSQFEKDLANLNEQLRHLHHLVPETDLKVEAWYMVQDVEVLYDKAKGYPFLISSRVMLKISTPENGTQDSGPPA